MTPRFDKICCDTNNKDHVNYLRAQVNFPQLPAETAGIPYLRRFLPASAGIFTCGTVYLQPSQVYLHAPVLQCTTEYAFNFVSAEKPGFFCSLVIEYQRYGEKTDGGLWSAIDEQPLHQLVDGTH